MIFILSRRGVGRQKTGWRRIIA